MTPVLRKPSQRIKQCLLSLFVLPIVFAACSPGEPFGVPNRPPTANAGTDQVVNAGASVTLDGSASSDPDGDSLSFSWRQVLGTSVPLSSTSGPIVTFTAPEKGTALAFEVTVSDGKSSAIGKVNVSVHPTDSSAQVIERRQPSILDDPAVTGQLPDGWTFPTLPPGPQKLGEGAPGWIEHMQGGPADEVELAPGATHRVELQLTGMSILMGSAKWIGTTDELSVTLSLGGTQLTTGQGYSIGTDRGGSDLAFVTTGGGLAALVVTNTSGDTAKVRTALGALPL
jgi:hypothetical protein